jgi:hypothetical protein
MAVAKSTFQTAQLYSQILSQKEGRRYRRYKDVERQADDSTRTLYTTVYMNISIQVWMTQSDWQVKALLLSNDKEQFDEFDNANTPRIQSY